MSVGSQDAPQVLLTLGPLRGACRTSAIAAVCSCGTVMAIVMDTKGGRRFLPPRNRWRVSTPQPVMNELAGRSLGGYQLEEEIGRGSMGMVYRGKQIALGRE